MINVIKIHTIAPTIAIKHFLNDILLAVHRLLHSCACNLDIGSILYSSLVRTKATPYNKVLYISEPNWSNQDSLFLKIHRTIRGSSVRIGSQVQGTSDMKLCAFSCGHFKHSNYSFTSGLIRSPI